MAQEIAAIQVPIYMHTRGTAHTHNVHSHMHTCPHTRPLTHAYTHVHSQCMHTCTHISTHTYIHTSTHNVCTRVHTHMSTHMHTCAFTHICPHTCPLTCMHTGMSTHICYTHIHAQGRKLALSVACGWCRFSFKLILVTGKSDSDVSSLCLSEFTPPLSLGSQDFLSGFLFSFNVLIGRNHFLASSGAACLGGSSILPPQQSSNPETCCG